MMPNDFKNAIAAINFGEPVVLRAPRAEISTSLTGLAGTLNGKAVQRGRLQTTEHAFAGSQ